MEISNAGENLVTAQEMVKPPKFLEELEKKDKYYILKIVLYGLIGLTGVFGVVIGSLWVKFKTKLNKRSKFIALIAGFLLSFVFYYGVIVFIHIKYPETKIIESIINRQYPNGTALFGISWNKEWQSGGEVVSTKVLTIKYKSKEFLSVDEILDIGKRSCLILNEEGKNYDIVGVINSKSPIYPLSVPFYFNNFGVSGTCEEWNSSELEESLRSMF